MYLSKNKEINKIVQYVSQKIFNKGSTKRESESVIE